MIKAIFFLILSLAIMIFIAPFVFVFQTIKTALFSGGFVKGWNGVADYFLMVATDGVDQLGATILYKVRDLTISSYTHVLCKSGKLCWFRKFIDFFFGKNHCQDSVVNELDEMHKSINTIKNSL